MATAPNYEWLDKPFLEKALRADGDPNIIVNSYEVKPATAAGDNYASDISRVKINLTRGKDEETKTLILKRGPQKEIIKKLVADTQLFQRESRALSTLLPEIHRLYGQFTSGQFELLSAKCYYSDLDSTVPVIVMEDLKEQGFRLADRTAGLDSKHCTLVMRALGRLHAASVVLHEKKSEVLKPFYENVYNKAMKDNLKGVFEGGMKDLAEEVEKWPEYKERFAHKLHQFAETITDDVFNSVLDEKKFNVVAHGDCWVNNMMFRYSEKTGEVEEVRFVDYQLCHFTNPAQDLLTFLYTSPTLNIMKDTQFFIEEYYNTLNENLNLFGFKHLIPSFPDLLKRLEEKAKIAIAMSGVGLSFIYADKDHIPDTEKLMSTDRKAVLHFNDRHKEVLKILLPIFEEKGWL